MDALSFFSIPPDSTAAAVPPQRLPKSLGTYGSPGMECGFVRRQTRLNINKQARAAARSAVPTLGSHRRGRSGCVETALSGVTRSFVLAVLPGQGTCLRMSAPGLFR